MSKAKEKLDQAAEQHSDSRPPDNKSGLVQSASKQSPANAAPLPEPLVNGPPKHSTAALIQQGGIPKLLATNLSSNPAKMSRLLIQADKKMADYAGKHLAVVGYLVGHGTIAVNNETGEITTGYWLRVLLEDGTTASTTSPTLIRSFACLAQMFPDGVWSKPVIIGIVSHDSANNPGKWYECYMHDENG